MIVLSRKSKLLVVASCGFLNQPWLNLIFAMVGQIQNALDPAAGAEDAPVALAVRAVVNVK